MGFRMQFPTTKIYPLGQEREGTLQVLSSQILLAMERRILVLRRLDRDYLLPQYPLESDLRTWELGLIYMM